MKDKFARFMQGRYGVDVLGRHLSFISLGFLLVGLIFNILWVSVIGMLFMVWEYFRMFSKNYPKRYEENRKYTLMLWHIKTWFKKRTRGISLWFKKLKEKPKYKHVDCEQCHQTMRVPRGKKNLTLTCPKCKHKQAF